MVSKNEKKNEKDPFKDLEEPPVYSKVSKLKRYHYTKSISDNTRYFLVFSGDSWNNIWFIRHTGFYG